MINKQHFAPVTCNSATNFLPGLNSLILLDSESFKNTTEGGAGLQYKTK